MAFQKLSTLTIAATLFCLRSAYAVAGEGQHFASQAKKVNLVELYSSEGCDSCPPAEAWLGSLADAPGLWRNFVPVGLHVDYWDYLGWRDPFGSPLNSQRQYVYANRSGSGSAYTPEVVLGGLEWRGWRGWHQDSQLAASTSFPGVLSADLSNGSLSVHFRPTDGATGPYQIHVATLGMDLKDSVERGENRGKTLAQSFVSLGSTTADLSHGGSEYAGVVLVPVPSVTAPRKALAIWVTKGDDPTPLQATGGYVD